MSQSWQTTADGDLWLHLELAIRAKGPDSIQFTWIKGHATDAHIADGITTLANKIGNDHADRIADEGTKLHGEEVYQIAKLYTQRHQQYAAFMILVAKHIIEAHMIHRALLDRAEQSALRPVSYTHLTLPTKRIV